MTTLGLPAHDVKDRIKSNNLINFIPVAYSFVMFVLFGLEKVYFNPYTSSSWRAASNEVTSPPSTCASLHVSSEAMVGLL